MAEAGELAARLSSDFPHIALPSLRKVLRAVGNDYAAAFAALQQELSQPVWQERRELARARLATDFPTTRPIAATGAPAVHQLRLLVRCRFLPECEVCCEERSAWDFLACQAGHRFCKGCVQQEAEERVNGQGAGRLQCLNLACEAGFGRLVLGRVLAPELVARMEEQETEQALAAAGLPLLERCPWCSWGAEVETPLEQDLVFRCGNEAVCGRASCRLCKAPWDEQHWGRRCEELETDAETGARRRLEEALTAAVLRKCRRCGLPFQKAEGCNRMTCPCGATSCYLCRQADVNYDHFCRHTWEPGRERCPHCAACRLFGDAFQVDQRRLQEARANH